MENSIEEQLAEARRENERLREALNQCRSERQRFEEDLERSHEEARAATEDMQHLIYAVSHDLRTPLRAIASYTQLLQRQYAADPEASELSNYAAQGVKEMNTLIEDLLRYSRAGSSPRRTNVGLNSLVQWAGLNVQAALHSAGGQLIYNGLPDVYVDESQFVQLFQHLFTNAINFRGENPPRIEITALEDADAHTVSVRDNGIGIEPQYLETIFLPFKRLQGKSVPGNGLGLSVCRKIVRVHGGRIWAESAGKSQGSTFKFTVPF
jgi:signal transduction histidine kinase